MGDRVWRTIPGYEGKYEVSTFGEVKSLARPKLHKTHKYRTCADRMLKPMYSCLYLRVGLYDVYGKCKIHRIHRLVAYAFLPNPEDKKEINHIDGDKTNNNLYNLEWATRDENAHHASKNKLYRSGLRNTASRPTLNTATGKIMSMTEACEESGKSNSYFSRMMNGIQNNRTSYILYDGA